MSQIRNTQYFRLAREGPVACAAKDTVESSTAGSATLKDKTSQELGNCPMGQKGALLKERLY